MAKSCFKPTKYLRVANISLKCSTFAIKQSIVEALPFSRSETTGTWQRTTRPRSPFRPWRTELKEKVTESFITKNFARKKKQLRIPPRRSSGKRSNFLRRENGFRPWVDQTNTCCHRCNLALSDLAQVAAMDYANSIHVTGTKTSI